MTLLGNVVWIVFGGFFAFVGYLVASLGLALTIVGIPFAVQSFKLGVAVLAPFGKGTHASSDADGPLGVVFNILWLLLFGWEIALHHIFWAFVFGISVVGIPFAVQHFKLSLLALWPFGRVFE